MRAEHDIINRQKKGFFMFGMIKTKDLYLAKIGLNRNKNKFGAPFKYAFITPVIPDEQEAWKIGVCGCYKFVTKNDFISDEKNVVGSQNYAYEIQSFSLAYPAIKHKRIAKRALKRFEKQLNTEIN